MSGLIHRILLATDLADEPAQAYASFLASASHAELHVVYVLEVQTSLYPEGVAPGLYIDRLHTELDVQLKDLVRRLGAGPGVHATQLFGPAAEGIVECSREYEADLIVLGAHERSGLGRLLAGGVGDGVLKGAPCPVLVVPTDEPDHLKRVRGMDPASATPVSLRHLLVPIDFSDGSIEACEYAIQLAIPFQASLTLLHVRQGFAELDETAAGHEVESRLQDLVDLLQGLQLPARYRLSDGHAGKAIARAVEEEACDLIVMGSHPRVSLATFFSRTVTQVVLRHPPCPALLVKSPKFQPGHRRIAMPSVFSES